MLRRDWLAWHWRVCPEGRPTGPGHPMDPETFEAALADLPTRHARPRGAIFIGAVDGRPVGCVMYHPAGDAVAEFKRMFVSEGGRGHAFGRAMLARMFEQMIADGYRKVVFSSAAFLTHARAMHQQAGFVETPPPPGLPDQWRDRIYFMERLLS